MTGCSDGGAGSIENGRTLGKRLSSVRESTTGAVMVFAAAAGFGTIGIFGEVAVGIDLELETLLLFRFGIATLAVLAVATVRGWSLPRSRRDWLATLTLGVVYTAMTLFFFVSLRFLTAGLATIVLYTYPVFVVGLSTTFLGETVTRRKLLALGLVTAGVVLVVGADTAGATPLGVVLALGAAACYAIYTAGSRLVIPTITPRGVMLGVLVGTTGSMAVYSLFAGGLSMPTGGEEWSVILGLVIVSTVVPHLLFYEGVSRLEASRVGVVSTVEPVVTVALGALLLGEPVTPFGIAGGVLVLGGVLLVQRRRDGTEVRSEATTASERSQ